MGVYLGRNKVDVLGGTPMIISENIDTSGLTATASDIAEGEVAIGFNGQRVIGNVKTISGYASLNGEVVHDYNSLNKFGFEHTMTQDELLRKNCKVEIRMPRSNFGTATASDVRKGVTFTSENGLLIPGEYEGSSLGITMTDDGNGNVTITGITMADDGNGNATLS